MLPENKLFAVEVVEPLLQLYEYGDTPPVTETEAIPLLFPKQVTFVPVITVVIPFGCVTEIVVVLEQPLSSVTVYV